MIFRGAGHQAISITDHLPRKKMETSRRCGYLREIKRNNWKNRDPALYEMKKVIATFTRS
jgi:hypothetical protein